MRAMVVVVVLSGCSLAFDDRVITRWEAAHELARVTCDEVPRTRGDAACYANARYGWCPTEDVCLDPIDDMDLYERCLVRVRNECWRLFRW